MECYIPAEMAPMEDRSQISINTRAAEGASYEYIRDYTEDINHLVDSLCLMPNRLRHVCRAVAVISNHTERYKDRNYTQMEVAERISKAIRNKTKARAFVQQQSFGGRWEACLYNMYCSPSVLRNWKKCCLSS